ncbi:MAG: DUF4190 domain-containing protein [Aeromicrobium erythreum]
MTTNDPPPNPSEPQRPEQPQGPPQQPTSSGLPSYGSVQPPPSDANGPGGYPPPPGANGPGYPPPPQGPGGGGGYGGYGAPGGYGPQPPQQNQKALISMILGIVSIVLTLCCPPIGIVGGGAGVALGIIGRKEISASNGTQKGEGMGLAGIITGAIGIVLCIAWILWALISGGLSYSFNSDF